MFPTGFAVTIVASEDGFVGLQLRDQAFRKVLDRSILVTHIAPATLATYWAQQAGRGKGFVQFKVLLQRVAWQYVALRTVAKTASVVLRIMTMSILRRAWQISKYSAQGRRDVVPFAPVRIVQLCAQIVGEWSAILEIARAARHRIA